MRPKGMAAELEARRFRAAELLRDGKSTAEVARLVGAGHSSVKKWKAALAQGGPEALAAKTPPPRISKLDDSQKQQLVEILLRGPLASGYRTDLWTCRRVAHIVRKTFGVSYHPDHLGRILHELGFTPQKPEQLAREHEEEAVRRWRKVDWPRIQRGRAAKALPWFFLMNPVSICSR